MKSVGLKQGEGGFTLLELLLAIFIFSVVISSVYAVYRSTFFTVSGTESQIEMGSKARVILERVSADLESLYVGTGGVLSGERQDIGDDRADTLTFTTAAHLRFDRSHYSRGVALVSYTAEEDENGLITLFRSQSELLPGAQVELSAEQRYVIGHGLRAFTVTFVTDEGEELEEWDSGAAELTETEAANSTLELPVMAKISVALESESAAARTFVYRTAVALPQTAEGVQP